MGRQGIRCPKQGAERRPLSFTQETHTKRNRHWGEAIRLQGSPPYCTSFHQSSTSLRSHNLPNSSTYRGPRVKYMSSRGACFTSTTTWSDNNLDQGGNGKKWLDCSSILRAVKRICKYIELLEGFWVDNCESQVS